MVCGAKSGVGCLVALNVGPRLAGRQKKGNIKCISTGIGLLYLGMIKGDGSCRRGRGRTRWMLFGTEQKGVGVGTKAAKVIDSEGQDGSIVEM